MPPNHLRSSPCATRGSCPSWDRTPTNLGQCKPNVNKLHIVQIEEDDVDHDDEYVPDDDDDDDDDYVPERRLRKKTNGKSTGRVGAIGDNKLTIDIFAH